MSKDFISFLDWSTDDLMDLVEAARTYRQRWKERRSPQALRGRRIALIWDAEGFRNRVAFELGIAELGGASVQMPGALDERGKHRRHRPVSGQLVRRHRRENVNPRAHAEAGRVGPDSGDKCKNFVQPSMRDPRGSGPCEGNER